MWSGVTPGGEEDASSRAFFEGVGWTISADLELLKRVAVADCVFSLIKVFPLLSLLNYSPPQREARHFPLIIAKLVVVRLRVGELMLGVGEFRNAFAKHAAAGLRR